MANVKISPSEVYRLSSRVNEITNNFNDVSTKMGNSCDKLLENIKTKQLCNTLQECSSNINAFGNLLYEDLLQCSKYMNQKAEAYTTYDTTLSQELNKAQDLVDQINFD